MTISNETRRQFFDGGLTSYDFTIEYFNANEIKVWIDAGSDFEIVDPGDYTLTAAASGHGGNILLDSTATAGTDNVMIEGVLAFTQGTTIPTVDKLSEGTLETVADKNVVLAQQVNEVAQRAFRLPKFLNTSDFDAELPQDLTGRRAIMINADLTGIELSSNDPDDAADAVNDATDAAATAIAAANSASSYASASAVSAAAALASQVAAAASAAAALASQIAAGNIVAAAGLGTVTSVATGGLATGGTFTNTGTVTVTAASTTEVLVGTSTTKAVTPDALAAIHEKGADTASATTVTLPEGGYCHITGTTTITGFANPSGGSRHFTTIFDGILQLTHSSTFVLKGAANIATVAGDSAEWIYDGSSTWKMVRYNRAAVTVDGAALSAASQAEQEAGTEAGKYVAPATQQFHPSAVKFWLWAPVSGGVPSNAASYNVSSIVDLGTGQLQINIDTDFSSANYCIQFTLFSPARYEHYVHSQAAGNCVLYYGNIASDPGGYYVSGYGDQ